MNENAMLQLVEQNLAEYQIAMGKALKSSFLIESADFTGVITDVPFYMYNGVFKSNLDGDQLERAIERVTTAARDNHVPLVWQTTDNSSPKHLVDRLIERGFTHYETEPGMVLDLTTLGQSMRELRDFHIARVSTAEQLQDWVRVWAYDGETKLHEQLAAVHSQFLNYSTSLWTYYVGYQNNTPVATALLFCGTNAAAVHWVVTIPEARRQGIGALMTTRVLEEAKEIGYSNAVLTASPDGLPIYKRLGFIEYGFIHKYIWRP